MTTILVAGIVLAFMVNAARGMPRKQGRSTGRATVLALLLGPLGLLIVYLQGPNGAASVAETGVFKLKGFVMDTNTGQFTINGFTYSKSDFRSLKWEDGEKKGTGIITIVVNDLRHPVHNINFPFLFGDYQASVERMRMLLCD